MGKFGGYCLDCGLMLADFDVNLAKKEMVCPRCGRIYKASEKLSDKPLDTDPIASEINEEVATIPA